MICPKCGEKYEDDMPRCLWCDAPNPNLTEQMKPSEMILPKTDVKILENMKSFNPEVVEKTEIKNGENSNLEKNLDGTLIFWLAALFGTLGIHCILSKRYLRGYAYLFVAHWDILIKMFCPSLWRIMPYWVPVIIFFCNLVITVFCLKDVYAISKGCYDNVKNKQLYKSKTWMKSCFVFAIVFHIVLLCNYLMYVVSAFTSM